VDLSEAARAGVSSIATRSITPTSSSPTSEPMERLVGGCDIVTSRDGLRFSHRILEHPEPQLSPTLFVSGAFQTMDSWARFAKAFAPLTTVLLVDPPGMGASDPLPAEVGIGFLAGCLEQVLDEHGVDRANVVAASYGTPGAFELARTRPDRGDQLVLGGTMTELPRRLRERIAGTVTMARAGDAVALADEVVDGMLCHDPRSPIDRRHLAARVLHGGIARMTSAELGKFADNTARLLAHDPLDISRTITGPRALVFTGEHDVFTSPADNRRVASAFEDGWFTTIRRADHLFHLEQSEVVLDLLLRFFTRDLGVEGTPGTNPIVIPEAEGEGVA
jgi:pimeloyl-ACP methyl ester carboxylesterase